MAGKEKEMKVKTARALDLVKVRGLYIDEREGKWINDEIFNSRVAGSEYTKGVHALINILRD